MEAGHVIRRRAPANSLTPQCNILGALSTFAPPDYALSATSTRVISAQRW